MRWLPDTNIWLALVEPHHSHHQQASDWLAGQEDPGSVAFVRATQQSLLRLMTTAAVVSLYGAKVPTNAEAWALYQAIRQDPRIFFAQEFPGLDTVWQHFGAIRTASPKLWMDAYLAAFAMAGGFRLVTTDKAFKQFKGLDPLVIG